MSFMIVAFVVVVGLSMSMVVAALSVCCSGLLIVVFGSR